MGADVMTIGLLHHTGGGNLGDEGTQAAAIQNIRLRWPKAEIVGLTMNPDDTRQRHGIPAYPIRRCTWSIGFHPDSGSPLHTRARRLLGGSRLALACLRGIYAVLVRFPLKIVREIAFLFRSFAIVRSLDLLIVNGGGQLTEWGGPWEFTYTVFKWVLLARLAAVRCIFVNVGAGPLTRPLSKWFARRSLRLAAYASFRDERSRALVLAIGLACAGEVFPDTVYSLDLDGTADVETMATVDKRQGSQPSVVGLAPMPFHDPRTSFEKDQPGYDRYIARMADFTTWLVDHGHRVVLFGSDIGVDPLAIDDVKAAAEQRGAPAQAITTARIDSIHDLVAQMSAMDYIVTSRLHGVIYAHLLNKPVLAISTHPKVATIMDDIGLSRFCVDVERCDRDELARRFMVLSGQTAEVRQQMTDVRVRYRRQLSEQFDRLFPPEAA